MLKLPENLPAHLREFVDDGYPGHDEQNRRLFLLGQWFCGQGIPEEECADLLVGTLMVQAHPKGNRDARARKSISDGYEKYDPAKAVRVVAPDFADDMGRYLEVVKADTHRAPALQQCLIALVQHGINQGFNPVSASARQVADALELKTWVKVSTRLAELQANLADGALSAVHHDGNPMHARLWEFNLAYAGGVHIYRGSTYVPLETDEDRFTAWAEALPMGVGVTAKYVSWELKISQQKARGFLTKYTDLLFGGGFYEGDARTRTPAKWWREPTREQRVAAINKRRLLVNEPTNKTGST